MERQENASTNHILVRMRHKSDFSVTALLLPGISYRDKAYDHYMNSQECLFGPGTEFLSHYKVGKRSDLLSQIAFF